MQEDAEREHARRGETLRRVRWLGDRFRVLDQTKLPAQERFLDVTDVEEVAAAIRRLAVRGAPLLGIVAGYGMAPAALRSQATDATGLAGDLDRAARVLTASRPTAVNIAWAVRRVASAAGAASPAVGSEERSSPAGAMELARRAAVEEASRIDDEERSACDAMGSFGAGLVPEGARILTHCNTGALATGWAGSAQAMITTAHELGKRVHVWVDETRPVLQGARLTAWELQRLGVPMTLVADTAAGSLMAAGKVTLVAVGADRIAANGDVANKVGTYQLAVLAHHHGVPFYVVAPMSTVDAGMATGADIPIEERDPDEVTAPFGVAFAPVGTAAANPAFDITPAELVTAIVTDRGVIRTPFGPALELAAAASAVASGGSG